MPLLNVLGGIAPSVGAVVFGCFVAWLASRRPAFGLAMLWLLIPLAWRVVDALYIDLAGPVFSEQLSIEIGPGRATSLLAMDCMITVAMFALVLPTVFSGKAWRGDVQAGTGWHALRDWSFLLALGFILAAYVEMLVVGTIPLLEGLERYDYAREQAGPLYSLLFRFGDPLALYLGSLFVLPQFGGAPPDRRFIRLLLAMMVFAFLAGHRYSTFFKLATMFVIPCATVVGRSVGAGIAARRPAGDLIMAHSLRVLFWAAITIAVPALLVSYFFTRFDDPEQGIRSLAQRTLIQQAELWWLTYQRAVELGTIDPRSATEMLFLDAIDPSRNTSIQYLMYLALGDDALRILELGTQYAGGFPEIFHELFGPLGGIYAVAAAALVSALLLRMLLRSLALERPLTLLCSGLVFYPFAIMYWGGMLNFVLAWTFWAKLIALVFAWMVETALPRRGVRLLPWISHPRVRDGSGLSHA